MQPNREGPTVKNMVDNLCQEHDTYPFDTNKHFFPRMHSANHKFCTGGTRRLALVCRTVPDCTCTQSRHGHLAKSTTS